MPNIGLEALALGKPVIASLECGGLVELAEEFGVKNLQIVETGVDFSGAVETVIDGDASRDFSVLAEPKTSVKVWNKNVMRQYTKIIYG